MKVLRARFAELALDWLSGSLPHTGDLIEMPLFDDVNLTGVVRSSNTNINGTQTVSCTVQGTLFGRAFFSRTGDELSAVINIPDRRVQYRIVYNPAQRSHAVVEMDVASLPFDDVGEQAVTPSNAPAVPGYEKLLPPSAQSGGVPNANHPAPPTIRELLAFSDEGAVVSGGGDPAMSEDAPAKITVDLMFVYTPAALAAAGSLANLQNQMALAVQESNDVLTNNNAGFELRLVHAVQTSYTESGDASLSDELNRITNTSDGYMDEIHALRDTYKADFVQLITDENGGGGIGWQLPHVGGSPTYGFTVCNYESLVGVLTPVHELGHNMGAHHAVDQNYQAGPGIYPDSAGWHWHPSPGQSGYCTIMTYTGGSYFADGLAHSRVPYFSDPLVSIEGYLLGDESVGNNARALRVLKRIYAEYRTSENFIPVLNNNYGLSAQPTLVKTLSNQDLQASDANGYDTPTQLIYTLASAPSKGLLQKSGSTLSAASTFTQQDIDDGLITYTSNSGQTGSDGFVFHLRDSLNAGIENQSFTITIDSSAPTTASFSPSAGYASAGVLDNLVLTFTENVAKGSSGNILIKKISDNSTVESIAITSAQITTSGSSLTINPSVTFDVNTGYFIEIPTPGTIKDKAGNDFAGLSGSGIWYFTTATDFSRFVFEAIASPQYSPAGFAVTVTAKKSDGTTDTAFTGAGRRATLKMYHGEVQTFGSGATSAASFLTVAKQENREDTIYYQSEIGAATTIYGISVNIKTVPNPTLLTNFTVRLAHTTKTAFATTDVDNASLVTCYRGDFTVSSTGWVDIPFSTNFSYNGTDNLIVSFSHDNPANGTNGSVYTYTPTPPGDNRRMYMGNTDGSGGDPVHWDTLQYVTTSIPQIRFKKRNAEIAVTPSQTGDFSSGVWTGSVVPASLSSGAVLFAEAAGHSGDSNIFAVEQSVSITTHPAASTIVGGQTGNLAVTASAATGYQWYRGNSGDTTNPISGATASSFTTPALFLTTTYWVRVTGTGGTVDSNAATVTVRSFDQWSATRGLSGADALLTADPDGDGLNNLMEYALHANPTVSDPSVLPDLAIEGADLTITYRKNKNATDITYVVQSSVDLVTWSDQGSGVKLGDLDAETESWKFSVSTSGQAKLFLRIKFVK